MSEDGPFKQFVKTIIGEIYEESPKSFDLAKARESIRQDKKYPTIAISSETYSIALDKIERKDKSIQELEEEMKESTI